MRVFCCRMYIPSPREKRLKWDPKTRVGICLCYNEASKAHRFYNVVARRMVISCDISFDESVFGFLSTSLDEDIDELNFLDLISIPILLQIRSTSRQKSEKVAQVKIKTY